MNELIKIETNENGEPRISGRELHEFLEVGTEYMKWTERYFIPFGFEEGTDFSSEMTKSTGGRPAYVESPAAERKFFLIPRWSRPRSARQPAKTCHPAERSTLQNLTFCARPGK